MTAFLRPLLQLTLVLPIAGLTCISSALVLWSSWVRAEGIPTPWFVAHETNFLSLENVFVNYPMQIQRKSYFELDRIYFFTATIHQWQPLLSFKENKKLIVTYLNELSKRQIIFPLALGAENGILPKIIWIIIHLQKFYETGADKSGFLNNLLYAH